jgi:hypothetical protein
MLVEKDYDVFLLSNFGGDEDRDVRLILFDTEGQADGVKTKVVEAFQNFFSETC